MNESADTVVILAQRWRGGSLVRTRETKRALHRISTFAVTNGERAEHFRYYVTETQTGRRVPESGHYRLETAKRHADACAVVFAGVDMTRLRENEDARALLREVAELVRRGGDLVFSKGE